MASLFNPRPRHLDANSGREVVYCHICSHEWYRDESPSLSLVCPSCRGEITEIVEANNDPRFDNGIGSFSRFFGNRGADSDPEEDDIANVVGGSGSPPLRPDRRPFNDGDRLGVPPGSDVLSRFIEMMMDDLGGGRVVRDAQGPGGLFGPNFTTEQRGGTRIHHRTFTSGPNTTTSVTFTTGPMPIDGPAANLGTLFGSLMGTPQPLDANNGNRSPRAGDPPGLGGPPVFRFGHLLASILSPGGFNGDAVYSQEELDRIITQLMEHTPSNAAPPASQSAIESLEKKIVDDEMLGSDGRAECTICIDELKKGDEVTVLPCTHWYHEECVTLWLKEHNTCPICRKPVEAQDAAANNNGPRSPRSPGLQQSDAGPSSTASPRSPQSEGSRSTETSLPNWLRASTQRSDQIRREMERDREAQSSRQANPDSQEDIRRRRLERIRQAAGLPSEESPAGSSSQRRSSVSPPGAWPDSPSQSRVRSPSFSHTRENEGTYFGSSPSSGLFESIPNNRRSYAAPSREQREAQQNSSSSSGNGNSGGGGLFGWMRDHFGRNSGNNSDRDRRR